MCIRDRDKFRDWLKSQPPEEILKHTYEYTVREDILMAMEELDLPQSRAAALLASSSPLADVYKEFSDRETSYMDVDVYKRQCPNSRRSPWASTSGCAKRT